MINQSNSNISTLEYKQYKTRTCEDCIKSDVCKYKDGFMKAKAEAEAIESNLFVNVNVTCEKWAYDNSFPITLFNTGGCPNDRNHI